MNVLRLLFVLFLSVPLIEIYVLIQAGAAIGVFWTIALIVLTAILGAALVRQQGFSTMARARHSLQHRQLPALEILEGACLLVAGALLLTPGFVTDAVGFALLLSPLRRTLLKRLIQRLQLRHGAWHTNEANVLKGEYRRLDD